MELAEPLSAEGLTYLRALARRPNDRCLGADREKEKMSESMEKLEARVKSLGLHYSRRSRFDRQRA